MKNYFFNDFNKFVATFFYNGFSFRIISKSIFHSMYKKRIALNHL